MRLGRFLTNRYKLTGTTNRAADSADASDAEVAPLDAEAAPRDMGDAPRDAGDAPRISPHILLGQRGEALAAEHLRRAGYRLVAANFKLPVGRNRRGATVEAEIDIVAYEGSTLCFVEVKTRASDWFAAPETNVDLRKQRQISRAARVYRRTFDLAALPHRYDVVSIILPPTSEDGTTPPPRLRLLRNFWTDAKFRKRTWNEGKG